MVVSKCRWGDGIQVYDHPDQWHDFQWKDLPEKTVDGIWLVRIISDLKDILNVYHRTSRVIVQRGLSEKEKGIYKWCTDIKYWLPVSPLIENEPFSITKSKQKI